MDNEVWKDIIGYEQLYQVSNLGNIKSLNYRRTNKAHLLKQTINNDGYKLIMLYKKGKSKMLSVHRLVAQAFLDDYNKNLEVNHIDNNKQNNKIDNLEMLTHKENTDYRDLTNKPTGNSHLKIEEVKRIREEKRNGKKINDVWITYKNKISLKGFEKVWYGVNWKELKENKC